MKKQTVWLLTLFSLMVVLSVYYLNQSGDASFLTLSPHQSEVPTTQTPDASTGEVDQESSGELTPSAMEDDLFSFVRLEMSAKRGERLEQLETVIAGENVSSEEKWQAFEEIDRINQLETGEIILEETLKSRYSFEDVLVRTLDEAVVVSIKSASLTKADANNVMRDLYDELGPVRVEVKHYPVESS
ncbi:stage III sporulation protein AH [Halolactibacillus miurensis]|uniref:Stage III sporulation protein AH n=1 Tax=Halolactibacillus miurensis TaxID=306541 RepID=A0A1I6PSP9_9BACI|nr:MULTISPECIES: SpoIIIAH-like family protein [Halolactibacillus]GEM04426.1 stage III sporulation protein AH [Halolactibacillus miurensis]SFS43242.1 stage III sporulation protein AH [Halolactibacillus miurensis]